MKSPFWPNLARVLAASSFLNGYVTAASQPQPTGLRSLSMLLKNVQTVAATSVAPIPSAALFEMARKPVVQTFDSVNQLCPASCSDTGDSPSNWTAYHNTDRLAWCNETMLLDFAVYNPLDDLKTHTSIRSCSADANASVNEVSRRLRRDTSCIPSKNQTKVEASLQMAWIDAPKAGKGVEVVAAAQQMLKYLSRKDAGCKSTVAFASNGDATVGVYAGSQMQAQGITESVLQQFIDQVHQEGISDSMIVQLCGSDHGTDYALGLVANANASLAFVQTAVRTWSDGKCVTAYDSAVTWNNVTFEAPTPSKGTTNTTLAAARASGAPSVGRRADCSTIQVASGDSCATLASKCGISGPTFTQYNPSSTLCSTLQPDQHVCCSAGTLPDYTPKPNPDGSCASYIVVAGDNCYKIASGNSLSIIQLETFNTKTWGWTGCGNLQANVNICLSTGAPPMPAAIPNTVCGPQVPGTQAPPSGSGVSLADLNPCPLNACCDIWGQCGTTDEFCTVSQSTTGAPGTAAPGENGCISNCGTQIVIGDAPPSFMSIAYFEAFNYNRPCVNMDVTAIDTSKYTHIHFAFATVTRAFGIDISPVTYQFNLFKGMKGIKRILSFGGWSFSTDLDTYPIFRESVTAANRATFIANLVAFTNTHGLDGLDFDWEYPGAPDIPGIPAGNPDDGMNYFLFLYELRQALPAGISLSIAAPASFWYLKGFPIQAMAVIVDYIVYMTYDLHGQWDYGNKWSSPGCPGGDCLRSHINITETVNALSMITKAGVPSAKVIAGVTSYGRAFKMTTPGCVDEMCTYTGPLSGAAPGPCTGTAGYISNSEIQQIINNGGNARTYQDQSFSNILVYNDLEWVAYMDDSNKALRTSLFQAYHLGGTTDWAVDLNAPVVAPPSAPGSNGYYFGGVFVEHSTGYVPGSDGSSDPQSRDWCENVQGGSFPVVKSKGANDMGWMSLSCTIPEIDNIGRSYTAKQRWEAADALNALLAFRICWVGKQQFVDVVQRGSWSEGVFNYFHGTDNQHCERYDEHGCNVYESCKEAGHAAGFLVMNSFITLHNIHNRFRAQIEAIWTKELITQLSSCVSTFSPNVIKDDTKFWKILLDVIGLGFAIAAAPVWNIVLKSSARWAGDAANALGTIKDTTNSVVSGGISIIKDSISPAKTSKGAAEQLAFMAGELKDAWQAANQASLTALFSPDQDSWEKFVNLIDEGAMIYDLDFDDNIAKKSIESALWATLIPWAWGLSNDQHHPFVMIPDDINDLYGCKKSSNLDSYIQPENQDAALNCVGNWPYYLVSVPDGCYTCAVHCGPNTKDGQVCTYAKFRLLPGIDQLIPEKNIWGSVTRDQMVQGSLASYKANGNKNGYQLDQSNPESFVNFGDMGLKAAGFFTIPVCTAKEAFSNLGNPMGDNKNYPCNP